MRRRRRVLTVSALVLVLLAQLSPVALAGFSDRTTSPAINVATGSLAAPTTVSATAGCAFLAPRVTLAWAASASSITTGYRVLRSAAPGVFTEVGTVQGQSTTTFTDSGVVGGVTYSYVVQSVYLNWSTGATPVAATPPLVCL